MLRWLTLVLALCVVSGTSRGEPRNLATQTLWSALLAGDPAAVSRAVEQGADLSSRGERGDTALHLAVRRAHDLPEIRQLLDGGADPNALNDARQSPLVLALISDTYDANPTTKRHRTEVASLLLERGATPRDSRSPARNLLEAPLARGEGRLVGRLFEAGAVLPDDALMLAMQPASLAADPNLLRTVLARSTAAQFLHRGERGVSPAHRALASEVTFVVLEASIAAGVSPDATADGGWSLVHEAASIGNLFALDWLVTHGAKVDALTADGRSALHVAAGGPNPRTIEWLLARGLDRTRVDGAGRTPLAHFLHSRLYRLEPAQATALAEVLGGTQADVARRAQPQDRAMFEAIWLNDLKAVKARIATGGVVNSVDGNGYTPLGRALTLAKGDLVTADEQAFGKKLLTLLVEKGADPSLWIPAENMTHWDYARAHGMGRELERLIQRRR